jgi:hypothetical protein
MVTMLTTETLAALLMTVIVLNVARITVSRMVSLATKVNTNVLESQYKA